jgi:simple sugar transport system permease protein
LIAPVIAVAVALLACSVLIVLSTDRSPAFVYGKMWEFGSTSASMGSAINRAVPLYLSAVAVAIGFKMGLFNIGVEGQYRLAVLIAAWAGAQVTLPAPLHVGFIIVVAMVTGGLWAALPAVLKVSRGINEVISTIMLNAIATGLAAWLFDSFLSVKDDTLSPSTKDLPASALMPDLGRIGKSDPVTGWALGALVLGVVFAVVVWRTRFGFDLRASGANPTAARVSGIPAKAMIARALILSGAVAGLVGLPALQSDLGHYSNDLPIGLGILDRSALVLDLEGIPREVVRIMQAVIVLAVVIAYEVVGRWQQRRIQSQIGSGTGRVDTNSGPAAEVAPA